MKSLRFHLWTLGAWALGALVWAVEPSQERASSGYWFIGGTLSAAEGKSYYPISSVTKRHLYIEKGAKEKRLSRSVPVILQLGPAISDSLIRITNLEASYSSSLPALIEARAVSEMMRHEMGTDVEISTLPPIESRSGRRRLNYNEIETLKMESKEYQDSLRDHADFGADAAENRVDTLHLEFGMTPDRDYRNVYAAFAVSFDMPGRNNGEILRGSEVMARHIGDLATGEIEVVKARASLTPLRRRNTQCEIFLFEGDGTPIATNLSRRVRKIAPDPLKSNGASE